MAPGFSIERRKRLQPFGGGTSFNVLLELLDCGGLHDESPFRIAAC